MPPLAAPALPDLPDLPAIAADAPLGERLGPVIFWPVLAFLIAVIVWSLLRRRRTERAQAVAAARTWTKPSDYAQHHTVRWESGPAGFTPQPLHWPLAVAEVFGICTGTPWDRLTHTDPEVGRAGLEQAWKVTSRPELLERVHWLLREGHRVDFQAEVEDWSALDDAEHRRAVAEGRNGSTSDEHHEALWRLEQIRTDARGIRSVRFEPWDLVRAAMLVRAGHSLGWLTQEEAIDTLWLLAPELRERYDSWAELGDHFLRARWYWGAQSGLAADQEDAHDASRQRALLTPPHGPWSQVPWEMPVPASRLLIVDAMVAEGLLTEVPWHAPSRLADVLDRATAERLDARG